MMSTRSQRDFYRYDPLRFHLLRRRENFSPVPSYPSKMTGIRPRFSTGFFNRDTRLANYPLSVISRANKSLRLDDSFGKNVLVELSIDRTDETRGRFESSRTSSYRTILSRRRANKGTSIFTCLFESVPSRIKHTIVVRNLSIVIMVDHN